MPTKEASVFLDPSLRSGGQIERSRGQSGFGYAQPPIYLKKVK
jgi:hypothetical protein